MEGSDRTIIDVKDLVKRYGDRTVLDHLSFSVREGEIFGLLGPNGAGKSTAISILSTLLLFDEGEVRIEGLDLTKEKQRIKRVIGAAPQELAIYPELSAKENLLFFGRIYGIRGTALRQRAEEVLEMVQLTDRANDRADTFSGGMKRRLNIGVSLMHKPRILFLDEPTVGVDPQSRNFIFEHIERLNREGTTIIYTTHYMEEAERLCNRVAIMDQGRILATDSVQGLIGLTGGGIIFMAVPEESKEAVESCLRSSGHPGVSRIADGRLKIETNRVNDDLLGLIARCKELNAPILSLEMLKPNLEAVFLNLTGKRLRD